MTFKIKEDSFYLDDKKVFLNSGEIHYFRIKRELWGTHLEAAKEAGLTTVSTYVPWAWHEAEESVFDFDGATCPERDLIGWLKKCQEHGLHCTVKPGPFILAEYRGAGLPDWFMEKHGDTCKMRNSKGDVVFTDGVSLFNKIYLEKVTLWYDQIMPLISKYEVSAGGPIILMQICNEIGVFTWLAKQGDYCKVVKDRFIKYISNKFDSITEINKLWGTNYQSFKAIDLPPDGNAPYASKGDRGRDFEWHAFWRTYYADYLRLLTSLARERGVTVPFFHNLPGWIYGNGYEFPVNITMYEDLYEDRSDILFGVDHIPEFMSYRNMHDDRIINDITIAMQGNKPLFAAEFQSGSREYHVVTNPIEMELFYKASIANGLVGWNYYMFSQGKNPSRKGFSGDTFYWFNPLTADGERTSAFPLVQRMSKIIKTSESLIVNAKRKAEICVLFYPPHYATELERPIDDACELQFKPSQIRRNAYFDGLLKVLQILNIDYDMVDLRKATSNTLKSYKQVWAFSTDEMEAKDQQTIVDYTKSGGNLVLFPYLPDRELSQKPCTIIRDALTIVPSGSETIDSPLIDIYNFKDIKCANPQITYSEEALQGAEVIARTISGVPCGFTKALEKGNVTHLGTWLGFDTEGHLPVYEAILKTSKAKLKQAFTNHLNLAVRQRFTGSNEALLFIGNYYNEIQKAKVSYTHPDSGEIITIPYKQENTAWPELYGVLSPIVKEISKDIRLLHSTSDILSVKEDANVIEIIVQGHRDLLGEIVLEGKNIHEIKFVNIDGDLVLIGKHDNRILLNYKHKHNKSLDIKIFKNKVN